MSGDRTLTNQELAFNLYPVLDRIRRERQECQDRLEKLLRHEEILKLCCDRLNGYTKGPEPLPDGAPAAARPIVEPALFEIDEEDLP